MSIYDLERAENLYNSSHYENNTNAWEDATSEYRASAFLKALVDADIVKRVTNILDVGCGSGGVIVKLSGLLQKYQPNNKIQFHGTDLSKNAIKIAEQLYPNAKDLNVAFSTSLINELEGQYTVVSLIHVLEHCPDMLEMLGECEKKAEFIYINVPLEVNIFYALRTNLLKQQYLKYGHLHFFDENFFLCWLESNGFQIKSVVYSHDYKIDKKGIGYNLIKIARWMAGKLLGEKIATWLIGGYSLGVMVASREKQS